MTRDPFYREIITRLGGPLDPELFERCAADLLRADFPTLVPIRGGSDAGMDGAIADLRGEAYPLITTTTKRVSQNLTRSLQSYVNAGGCRRRAVLATSGSLIPARRRNLAQRGANLGFVLWQIFDQAAFADRLYRSPRWCLELLNLTGEPRALSAIPRSSRPLLDIPLVGREGDLSWLRDSQGDRLLVGVPGSGKTSLASYLVKDDRALFLVAYDSAAIANAVRETNPREVIVDDAHLDPNVLTALRQLRQQMGGTFSIVATSWEGDAPAVATALAISSSSTHVLNTLGRDQIVQVVSYVYDGCSTELVREIVDQADGRPGLAVTLAWLCRQGDVKSVVLGQSIAFSTVDAFRRLIGREPTEILACFAIGGALGMPLGVVAAATGVNLLDVRQMLSRLAVGGVIKATGNVFSVQPVALRHALVRDVFFGPVPLPTLLNALISSAPNLREVALTLIGASARGATIPQACLLRDGRE